MPLCPMKQNRGYRRTNNADVGVVAQFNQYALKWEVYTKRAFSLASLEVC